MAAAADGANVDHWYLAEAGGGHPAIREKISSAPGPVATSVGPVVTTATVCPAGETRSPAYEREEEDLAKAAAASLKAEECEGIAWCR